MLTSIQGFYHNGQVELSEQPTSVKEGTPVIVTFLQSAEINQTPGINLASVGIDRDEAIELRARLTSFIQEWDAPEMDIYDEQSRYKQSLSTL